MADIHAILKRYWGFDQFRPLQEDIIHSILAKKDTLALLPTGGGKSVCFQVPAMVMDGICIVISPLIALIKDQVASLAAKGIPALAVYSGMHFMEVKKTLQNAAYGNFKFLYLSPERLETSLFLEFLPAIKPSMIVVDEAHCISQWGYDFRPSYLRISNLREELPGVPVMALTASATPAVQDDICERLLFAKDARRFLQSFERANLSYSIFSPPAKETKVLEILKNVPGSAIVYCRSRKLTQQVAAMLRTNQVSADYYHAGLTNDERNSKQEDWLKNRTRVIVCTNAFGMGIDKPDVRTVIHFNVPDCLENYYQEAGRAGRDGRRAYAVLLHHAQETSDLLRQVAIRYPLPAEIKKIYTAVMNHLQVAAGSGEGRSFDFDMASFSKNFNLNILEATYGIQALAKEDLLTYNEIFFKPSSVVFSVNHPDLREFEALNPALEPVIKGLLRSYEGIFDFPVTIYESLLAGFIKMDQPSLVESLKKLHRYGIIQYEPVSEKPELYLNRNRMYSDDFKIDEKQVKLRRATYEQRVKELIHYIEEKSACRAGMLAAYFGAPLSKRCRICDNCINQQGSPVSPEQFSVIEQAIHQQLQPGGMEINQLIKNLNIYPAPDTWQVLNFLLSEEKVRQTGAGIVELNGI